MKESSENMIFDESLKDVMGEYYEEILQWHKGSVRAYDYVLAMVSILSKKDETLNQDPMPWLKRSPDDPPLTNPTLLPLDRRGRAGK